MLDESWEVASAVAIRPEPFGALAYNFENRRLTFLKRPELVAVVQALSASPTVREALNDQGIPATQWPVYVQALEALASSELITRTRETAHA